MSKLSRESIEKAEKFLAKKGHILDAGLRAELADAITHAGTLAADYRKLKDAAQEKRLDIEENARSLARVTRRAKKAADAVADNEAAKGEKAAAKAGSEAPSKKPAAKHPASKETPRAE